MAGSASYNAPGDIVTRVDTRLIHVPSMSVGDPPSGASVHLSTTYQASDRGRVDRVPGGDEPGFPCARHANPTVESLEGAAWAGVASPGVGAIATALGDVESLLLHTAVASHRALTASRRRERPMGPGLGRPSVGIEDLEDLWEDLSTAMVAA